MIEMKPVAVFRLGERKVIQCRMSQGRPLDAIGHEFMYKDGSVCLPIHLTGISTAWGQEGLFDFAFEGPLEPPLEPSDEAKLTSTQLAMSPHRP